MTDAVEKLPVRRVTVTSGQYCADFSLIADDWQRDDQGGLLVTRDGRKVAEFSPVQWGGIIDEDHRDPGYLKAARDGLSEILRLIRKAGADGHGEQASDLTRAIFEVADKAQADSYPEVPF